jgi:hypothetical protein
MKPNERITKRRGGRRTGEPFARINTSLLLGTIGVVCLLTVAGISKSGRSVVRNFLSFVAPSTAPSPAGMESPVAPDPDTEQRARARHGWHPGIVNSAARGTISYLGSDGTRVARTAEFTLYQKYGVGLRVELDRGDAMDVYGLDQDGSWKADGKVSDEEARAIRTWMRIWPERLFVTRASGAAYRESGNRIEDRASRAGILLFDEVEIEDIILPAPSSQGPGDRRFISYYVSRESSTIEAIRWLEPDDPLKSIDDQAVGLIDVRVDFADWREVAGILCPFSVTRSYGGRPEFRIALSEVKVNQPLEETIFNGK